MSEYRDPWPGLPSEWTTARVDEVAAMRVGKAKARGAKPGDQPTPYLRSANIRSGHLDLGDVSSMFVSSQDRAAYALETGDVVVSYGSGSAAMVGRSAVWRGEVADCVFQNSVIRLRPHGVDADFLALTLQNLATRGFLAEAARGVGIQHLGAKRLGRIRVPVPSIEEQRAVVALFAQVDWELQLTITDLQDALERLTEQTAETIRAAATGELVGASSRFESVPIGVAGEVSTGKTLQREPDTSGSFLPYLRVANVQEDRIDLSDIRSTYFTDAEKARLELRVGDLLVNEGQSLELVGRPALVRNLESRLWFQNSLLRVRARPNFDPEFLLLVFRHYMRSGVFAAEAKASTNIAHLSKSRFENIVVPAFSLVDQNAIAAQASLILGAVERQRSDIEEAVRVTRRMRQQLQLDALNGKFVRREPTWETGAEYLDRIGPVPARAKREARTPVAGSSQKREGSRMVGKSMHEALMGSGKVAPERLFEMMGLDQNDLEQVESFYLKLRDAISNEKAQVGVDAGVHWIRGVEDADS